MTARVINALRLRVLTKKPEISVSNGKVISFPEIVEYLQR